MKRDKAPLVPILLLAYGLRVWGLGDRNLWWDEGFSAWIAQQPAAQLVARTAQDVHPPLYYLLLHLWQTATGANDFALRYLSVIAGVLGVALIYQLARALGNRRAGWLAAFFLAISPFAVTWSQEMRMYTWAALWTTAGLWAAWQLWRSGRWRYWAVYVLACAAALWTLYLAASLVLIANIGFVAAWWRRRRDARLLAQWITAQAAVAALFLPWLLFMLPRAYFGWNAAEAFSPLFFLQLYATTLAAGVSENLDRYLLPTLLVMAIVVAVTVPLWRRSSGDNRRAGLVMLLAGLILPAALVYLGALPFDLFYAVRLAPRYFFPLAVCFYTLLALGLALQAEQRRALAAALTGVVAVTAILGLASVQGGSVRRDLYDSLVATLQAERQPGDAVVLHSDKDWPIFAAQYPGPWTGVPNAWQMDAGSAAGLLEPIWDAAQGVWLVTTPEAGQTDPQALVRGWLEDRAVATRAWDYGDNTLAFFARTEGRSDLLGLNRTSVHPAAAVGVDSAVRRPAGLGLAAAAPLRGRRHGSPGLVLASAAGGRPDSLAARAGRTRGHGRAGHSA
ncbi:MAG: glycosyltransferase family 39 protein [Caldilineales bacterium]